MAPEEPRDAPSAPPAPSRATRTQRPGLGELSSGGLRGSPPEAPASLACPAGNIPTRSTRPRRPALPTHVQPGPIRSLTLPKLPFPMARRIWKWSRFTAERAEGCQVRGPQDQCPLGPHAAGSPQHCREPPNTAGRPRYSGDSPHNSGSSSTLQ